MASATGVPIQKRGKKRLQPGELITVAPASSSKRVRSSPSRLSGSDRTSTCTSSATSSLLATDGNASTQPSSLSSSSTAPDSSDERAALHILHRIQSLSPSAFRAAYLSEHDLLLRHVPRPREQDKEAVQYALNLRRSDELPSTTLNACFRLLSSTSRTDYAASSAGWNPAGKKREMRMEGQMWYLLAHCTDPNAQRGKEETEFAGFLSLHPSTEGPHPILYIYELHLFPQHRSQGLGAHLLKVAQALVARAGCEKSMLTCFVRNTGARAWYRRKGFVVDVISPGDGGDEEDVEMEGGKRGREAKRKRGLRSGKDDVESGEERADYVILCRWREVGDELYGS